MRLEDVEPTQDRALVVGRPATDKTARLLVNDQCEGLGVPAIALKGLKVSSEREWYDEMS